MRLRRIEPPLRRALKGPCAVPAGACLLVAVSGGADSIALLLGLDRLAAEFGYRLHAAHLHHGLRGADADGDLAAVRELCARLAIPLTAARWNARARMRARGLAGQAGLRVLRREFLRRAAARAGAVRIATGHTADDQLETVLLRLARGTGLRGLGAMSARRGIWIRPLLEATRDEIERDLAAQRIRWREDGSNRDLRYARNRVRHEVVPALLAVAGASGRVPGQARAALARRASRLAAEARDARRALLMLAKRNVPNLLRHRGAQIALDSRRLRSYPPAIRRVVLARAWQELPGASEGLTGRHFDQLLGAIARPREGACIPLPCRCRATLREGCLVLGPSEDRTT
jgi:tRNA(Ile)-lysidine synthase